MNFSLSQLIVSLVLPNVFGMMPTGRRGLLSRTARGIYIQNYLMFVYQQGHARGMSGARRNQGTVGRNQSIQSYTS